LDLGARNFFDRAGEAISFLSMIFLIRLIGDIDLKPMLQITFEAHASNNITKKGHNVLCPFYKVNV